MEQARAEGMQGEMVMTSWRKTIKVNGCEEAAVQLCKVNVIKPAVKKRGKTIKPPVTKP